MPPFGYSWQMKDIEDGRANRCLKGFAGKRSFKIMSDDMGQLHITAHVNSIL